MASQLTARPSDPVEADVRPVTAKADLVVLGRVATGVPGAPKLRASRYPAGHQWSRFRRRSDALVGPGTEIIKQGDGVISPGLIEPHMHIWTTMLVYPWPDLSPIANPTFDDVVATVKAVAEKTPAGVWVTGKLFDPSLYEGEPDLTRDILDKVSPDNRSSSSTPRCTSPTSIARR